MAFKRETILVPTVHGGGPGHPLPDSVRLPLQGATGHDLSGIRVHPNSMEAHVVNSRAFSRGDTIHFAPGAYDPHSPTGRELIAHEATHVVQQRAQTALPNGLGQVMLPED
jgi:hypothetical protein